MTLVIFKVCAHAYLIGHCSALPEEIVLRSVFSALLVLGDMLLYMRGPQPSGSWTPKNVLICFLTKTHRFVFNMRISQEQLKPGAT